MATAAKPRIKLDKKQAKKGDLVVEKVKESKGGHGFNAGSGEYEDLIKSGIIDPALVVRTALQNAASIASLLLTTEAAIVEIKEKKKPAGGHDHDHGDDY